MTKKNLRTGEKVILFPKLEERLLDKGRESLQNRQFKEALGYFEQLVQYSNKYPEVEIGIVVCLLELGLYLDAKYKCERLLQEDVGDYFNVLQIYLSILIQLNEYDEVVGILEAIMEEEKIPHAHAEELFHLLQFARKRMQAQPFQTDIIADEPLHEVLNQLIDGEVDSQFHAIQQLSNKDNLHECLESIKYVLEDANQHPLVQSMLLQLLMDKQVNENIHIHKFADQLEVNPCHLQPVFEHPFTLAVLNRLDDVLGQENPSLFEAAKELWERFLVTIFPYQPSPSDPTIWAAALHKYGYELFGIEVDVNELMERYCVTISELENAIHSLIEMEDLSMAGMNL